MMTPIIWISAYLSKEHQKEFSIDVQKFLLTEKKCHSINHAGKKLIWLIHLLENKKERVLAFALCKLDPKKYKKGEYKFGMKNWKDWGLDPSKTQ